MSAFTVMTGFTTGTGEELLEHEDLDVEDVSPMDGDVGVQLEGLELNVTVIDEISNNVNVTFYVNESGGNLGDYTHTEDNVEHGDWANSTGDDFGGFDFEYGTEYEWKVNVTEYENEDENYTEEGPWTFTTEHIPNVPTLNNPDIPEDEYLEISPEMEAELNVTVNHPEGNAMNVTFYDGDHGQIGHEENVADGDDANVTWENLDYGTSYEWYVNVTEYENEENVYTNMSDLEEIWTFTTEEIPNKPTADDIAPGHEDVDVSLDPQLNVTVNHPEGENMNVTFYGNDTDEVLTEDAHKIGTHNNVTDEHVANITWEDRDSYETYYWKVMVSEYENEEVNTTSETWNFTTEKAESEVEDVEIDPAADQTITAGEHVNFTAEALDQYDEVMDDNVANFTWVNIDDDEIDEEANVAIFDQAIAGEYNVSATYDDVSSDNVTVTVEEAGVDEVIIDPAEDQEINSTETIEFSAEAYANGTLITDNLEDFTWEYVNEDGVFEETAGGVYEVTATFEGVSNATTVTVREPAFFDVNITAPEDGAEYEEGDTVTVEYTVTNTGDFEDTQSISFMEARQEDMENVTLGGGEPGEDGENYTGNFTWTAGEPGDYDLSVWSDDDDDSVTVDVTEDDGDEPGSNFEVEITAPEDGAEYDEGDTVTVEFTVENTGDEEGTQDIVFSIDGTEEDTMEITLEAGDSESDEFEWEAGEPGDYDLTVESDDDSDSVEVTVVEEAETELDMMMILGIIVIIVIILAIIGYMMKSGGEEAGPVMEEEEEEELFEEEEEEEMFGEEEEEEMFEEEEEEELFEEEEEEEIFEEPEETEEDLFEEEEEEL